jgi:hypothetical protein
MGEDSKSAGMPTKLPGALTPSVCSCIGSDAAQLIRPSTSPYTLEHSITVTLVSIVRCCFTFPKVSPTSHTFCQVHTSCILDKATESARAGYLIIAVILMVAKIAQLALAH